MKADPNAPMPCGFLRAGLKLKARLAHYRACSHPACKERIEAWEDLKKAAAVPGGIVISRKP